MPLIPYAETLVTAQGDGTALTAAARNSAIPAAAIFTLPANFFDVIGKKLMIKAWGRVSTDSAGPGTFRWDVNFQDSALANAIVFDSTIGIPGDTQADATNVNWELELVLTCRSIGTTATIIGQGRYTAPNLLLAALVTGAQPKVSFSAMLPWNTAPVVGATFNSTLSQQVDLRFTQTVAGGTPANSLTLHQYSLIRLN